MIAILVLLIVGTSYGLNDGCDDEAVFVAYRMTLKTYWTEESFPKNYPKNRPPAQWSAVFGQTHDANYSVFRMGKLISPGLQKFIEQADMRRLMITSRNEAVFDQFTASPISAGQGETFQDFFIDKDHRLISIVCKIIPSPDWFVGLDSYDMCYKGTWPTKLTIQLDPLDGGTDGGLTFTSPRWRAEKPEGVSRHGSKYPSHPAASFYYPNLVQLPRIAELQFDMLGKFPLIENLETTTEMLSETTEYQMSNLTFNIDVPFLEMNMSFASNEVLENWKNETLHEDLLNEEANEILNSVRASPSKDFPKTFRRKSHVKIEEKWSSSLFIPSNLLVSRLPSKYSNLTSEVSKGASFFDW